MSGNDPMWRAGYSRLVNLRVMTAVALPPLVWFVAAVGIGGMQPAEAVSAFAFRFFFVALCVMVVLATLVDLLQRRFAAALVHAGILLLLAQGVVWYGVRFHGEAGAGKGEQVVQYHREEKGAWPGDARIPARVERLPETANGPVEFSLDRKTIAVPLKGNFIWHGYRVTPLSVEKAPLVRVDSAKGTPVEALYYKLGTLPAERDFFLVKTMPHRIYVKGNGDRGVQVRIIRDKLEIVKKDLAWGERLYYDGHYLSFEQGEPWVRISVERLIRPYYALAGVILLGWGMLAFARKR